MGETNKNMWAPWRMEYIRSLSEESQIAGGCFLCSYAEQPDADGEHLVIWRTDHCLTLFNKFPYNNGHLLIAPRAHVAEFDGLEPAALNDFIAQIRDAQKLLKGVLAPHGYNVGMNFGRCAGAGLPDHLHAHIVPRWNGDTNFMPILGDVRVIPQSMEALYQQMREQAGALGLPDVRG